MFNTYTVTVVTKVTARRTRPNTHLVNNVDGAEALYDWAFERFLKGEVASVTMWGNDGEQSTCLRYMNANKYRGQHR